MVSTRLCVGLLGVAGCAGVVTAGRCGAGVGVGVGVGSGVGCGIALATIVILAIAPERMVKFTRSMSRL